MAGPTDPSYCIDREPCVPVLMLDGSHTRMGFRDVLVNAHLIATLALAIAPAQAMVLRVLTVLLARVTGLDGPHAHADAFTTARTQLLHQGRLDPQRVDAYLGRYCWDLYGSTPWWQDPNLPDQCNEAAGVNKLAFGRTAGNNLAWRSPHTDTDPVPLPSDEALWHLLVWHGYGDGGRCSVRAAAGTRSGEGISGPLRGHQSYFPHGRNLLETLVACLPKPTGHQAAQDLAPWEQPGPRDPALPEPAVTWPARQLLPSSRHALLLIADTTGAHVVDAYVTWSTQQKQLPTLDPFAVHLYDPKRALEQRLLARLADRHRALWREWDALLLAGHEGPTRRPAVFATLNDLSPSVRQALRVQAIGFDQDRLTMSYTWSLALTPPIWRWCEENDPARARRIAQCRVQAEATAAQLIRVATDAWKQATGPQREGGAPALASRRTRRSGPWTGRALAWYWPAAETAFWHLIGQDPPEAHTAGADRDTAATSTVPQPEPAQDAPADDLAEAVDAADPAEEIHRVFSRLAVSALRNATAGALRQHRRAGPAIAQAMDELGRPPRKPRPQAPTSRSMP